MTRTVYSEVIKSSHRNFLICISKIEYWLRENILKIIFLYCWNSIDSGWNLTALRTFGTQCTDWDKVTVKFVALTVFPSFPDGKKVGRPVGLPFRPQVFRFRQGLRSSVFVLDTSYERKKYFKLPCTTCLVKFFNKWKINIWNHWKFIGPFYKIDESRINLSKEWKSVGNHNWLTPVKNWSVSPKISTNTIVPSRL